MFISSSELNQEKCDLIVRSLAEFYSWRGFSYSIKDRWGGSFQGSSPYTAIKSAPIGCIAKAYTALLATEVLERYAISLDCPVIKIIPEFTVENENATRSITIRHLLSHRSGLDAEGLIGFPVIERDFWVRLNRVRQLFPPGENVSYCTLGFVIVACLVERVSQTRWEDLLVNSRHYRRAALDYRSLPIVSSGRINLPPRHEASICEAASLGSNLALPLGELAQFGLRCLEGDHREFCGMALWADDQCGLCICGTSGEINTRLQIVPELGVSIAARVDGPDLVSSSIHDFFRQILGSRWYGFIKPTVNTDSELTRSLIVGKYGCEFIEFDIKKDGDALVAAVSAGLSGERTWIGDSRKHELIRLDITSSGVLSGSISVGPDPFSFILEPLDYADGLRFLIFNRKMLLVRTAV